MEGGGQKESSVHDMKLLFVEMGVGYDLHGYSFYILLFCFLGIKFSEEKEKAINCLLKEINDFFFNEILL